MTRDEAIEYMCDTNSYTYDGRPVDMNEYFVGAGQARSFNYYPKCGAKMVFAL